MARSGAIFYQTSKEQKPLWVLEVWLLIIMAHAISAATHQLTHYPVTLILHKKPLSIEQHKTKEIGVVSQIYTESA